jgi:cell division protein FtsN
MARKDPRAGRREEAPARGGKRGGMFTGMLIGLVIGLVVAAGLAWYFNLGTGGFEARDGDPSPAKEEALAKPLPETVDPVPTAPADSSAAPVPAKKTETETTPTTTAKPRVDYTFYGILPGDKPAKPIDPPKSRETWWLQVAALKNPADADKLKARLTLLGLEVSSQKVESGGGVALYRVRVGPYKREDDALGDLDTLAENNFEPRLFKEPVKP